MKRTTAKVETIPRHSSEAFVTPQERTAAGKALRDTLPREQQRHWSVERERPDLIDLLEKSDAGRMKNLVPVRYGRMLQSPFAFYRGAAAVMASDLARTLNTGLMVQACGDCHLLNFGGFATPERNIFFDINDFDETLPAPWEWDVKRLVASIVLAARSNGLPDSLSRRSAVNCARKYREHMREFSKMDPLQVWYTETRATDFLEMLPKDIRKEVSKRIEQEAAHSNSEFDFPKLASSVGGQARITDRPPFIFHPESTRTADAAKSLDELFHSYKETLSDDRRILVGRYRLVDEAIKVVGVGSVGRQCWIALMMSESNDPLFLQFKEAVESVLAPYAGKSAYSHQGHRVVMGQRLMQPASDIFLGWATAASGRQFYVRQLHDAKIKPLVETYTAEMLDYYAQACGWVLARAHAKASNISATISGYLGSSSDEFDEAMGRFAVAYADQTESDYQVFKDAVRQGKIVASETPAAATASVDRSGHGRSEA